jgi:hypothetical protein
MLLALLLVPSATATAQEVMYSDSWNDEPDANLDLPLYGIGVTEEWGGYSPEKVETTFYGNSGEILDYSESSSGYFYVEAVVFHQLPWTTVVEAPANCAVTIHRRFLLDDGFETIGETLSQIIPRKYRGRYKYNRQLAAGDYEYIRATANCSGLCMGPRKCHTVQKAWLQTHGWVTTSGPLAGCLGVVIPTDNQPPCNMPGGFPPIDNYTACSGEN